jgi:hypothetical protein
MHRQVAREKALVTVWPAVVLPNQGAQFREPGGPTFAAGLAGVTSATTRLHLALS